jgi:hypothetical protein
VEIDLMSLARIQTDNLNFRGGRKNSCVLAEISHETGQFRQETVNIPISQKDPLVSTLCNGILVLPPIGNNYR